MPSFLFHGTNIIVAPYVADLRLLNLLIGRLIDYTQIAEQEKAMIQNNSFFALINQSVLHISWSQISANTV